MIRQGVQLLVRSHNQGVVIPIRVLSAVPQPSQPSDPATTRKTASDNVQLRTRSVTRNTSFMTNVFSGEIEPLQVFPYPEQSDEQKELIEAIIDPINRFLDQEHDPVQAEKNGQPESSTIEKMFELGILSLICPEKYGGLGMSNAALATMGVSIGKVDLGLGVIVGGHQSLGWKGILMFGTEEQKQKYLPKVTSGKLMAAFAVTEPGTGSDLSSVKSKAVKSACGKFYVLNGSKIWITNGGEAEIFTVIARTEVLDSKTGKQKDKLTAFIVERAFDGVSSGTADDKMGITVSRTSDVFFDDVKIPVENILGGEGNGFKVAVSILNNGRFVMGGPLDGMMQVCIQKATEHALRRVQFGRKIIEFGNVQEKLARMALYQYVTQSMTFMVAGNMDAGSINFHLETAISKIFSSEAAFLVCDEAIQILGGNGYMKSSGLEKFLRDSRVFRIFDGANDVLRMYVALTGIQYAGSYLKQLKNALQNPASNIGLIWRQGSRRAARTIGMSYTSDMSQYVVDPLKDTAKQCSASIELFSAAIESLLMKHGKGIVDQQFALKRVADSAIDIYAMICVLSRASRTIERNLPSAEHELLMTRTWCSEASERVQENIRQLHTKNFAKRCDALSQIAKNICNNEGVVQNLPLELSIK